MKLTRNRLLLIAGAAAVSILIYEYRTPIVAVIADEQALSAWVASLGVLGPIAIVLLQILQIVVAPIPGQVVGMAAGALYGLVWGSVLNVLGGTFGAMAAITLARRFGQPLAAKYADSGIVTFIRRFDRLRNPLLWSVIFALPVGDALCFAAGMTTVALPRLFVGAFLGRLPQQLLATAFGSAAQELGGIVWVVGLILGGIVSLVSYYYADSIKAGAAMIVERFDD